MYEIARRIYEAYGGYTHMTPALALRIAQVAEKLGINPYTLANVLCHESGFYPRAQARPGEVALRTERGVSYRFNPDGRATGILQFVPSTAERLGTNIAEIWAMTGPEQMDLVETYLSRIAAQHGPLSTPHRMWMAVFYPAYIAKSPDTVFPEIVTANNPGVVTPRDYIQRVMRSARLNEDGTLRNTFLRGRYVAGSAAERVELLAQGKEISPVTGAPLRDVPVPLSAVEAAVLSDGAVAAEQRTTPTRSRRKQAPAVFGIAAASIFAVVAAYGLHRALA